MALLCTREMWGPPYQLEQLINYFHLFQHILPCVNNAVVSHGSIDSQRQASGSGMSDQLSFPCCALEEPDYTIAT